MHAQLVSTAGRNISTSVTHLHTAVSRWSPRLLVLVCEVQTSEAALVIRVHSEEGDMSIFIPEQPERLAQYLKIITTISFVCLALRMWLFAEAF